ncbi:MAG TPA: NUDIX domain-containing protein, partial [Pyrinomonadaceae bacterium]|nr:NUDIX domain-containing protein [Pyrinomonadaceae bacterium]
MSNYLPEGATDEQYSTNPIEKEEPQELDEDSKETDLHEEAIYALTNAGQILDVVKQEWAAENCWSDWDQETREKISEVLARLYAEQGVLREGRLEELERQCNAMSLNWSEWARKAASLQARVDQLEATQAILKESRPYPVLVVAAIIIRDGKVLLERRAPAGVAGLDDMWDLPGGKVECGEQPADALMREIREELGVTIWPLQLCPTLKRSVWTYPNVGEKHWLLAAYVCELHGEPTCGDRLAWRPIADLTLETVLRPVLEFI